MKSASIFRLVIGYFPRRVMVMVLVWVAIGSLVVPLGAIFAGSAAASMFTPYATPTTNSGLSRITVGPDDNLWFAETDGNRIAKATVAGVITEFLIPTAGSQPYGIVTGPDNNVWFTETAGGKVGKITTAGVITEYSIPTLGAMPHGIAAGPDGNLWFTETGGNKIASVDHRGVITEYPVPTVGAGPAGIASGSDGNLWFTESGAAKVGRITTGGVITEFPVASGHTQWEMTAGPDGNLWFTPGSGAHSIGRVTTDGSVTEFPTDDPNSAPNYIGAGPDGNVWYTDMGGSGFKVGMITPGGDVTEFPYSNLGLPAGIVAGPDGMIWFVAWEGSLVKMRITPDPSGEFTSLTPARILDTRDGTGRGGITSPLGEGASFDVQITGRGGVPGTPGQVSAVVLNATVVEPSASSFLTVWPAGLAQPLISNLNYLAGQVVPNLVTVAVGAGGKISVYNRFGTADVIFDVVGYYSSDTGPLGSRFHGLTPFRYFDTRDGTGGVATAPLGPSGVLKFTVTGKGGVPVGATGVVMNVTVTGPTDASFLTVYPDDVTRPLASNLNYIPGLTVPNLVVMRVPASGIVDLYNRFGAVHVLADVVGYYDADKTTEAGRFVPVTPVRRGDTRVASPFPAPGKIPGGSALVGKFPGFSGLPASGIDSVVLNVTVTEPDTPSFVTVFPADGQRPLASNLNFTPGQTVPNLVIVKISTGPPPVPIPQTPGWVEFFNKFGNTHLVIDVFGYFTDANTTAFQASRVDDEAFMASAPR